jgi:hypothetical protein
MPMSRWWRETGALYVRYLIVGVASIPAAIVYAYLVSNKLDRPWMVLLLLLCGLGLASLGWKASAQLLARRTQPIPTLSMEPHGFGSLAWAIATRAQLQSYISYTAAMPPLAPAPWFFSIVNTGRQPVFGLPISLRQHIHGQNEMVSAVAKAVQQATAP